MDKICVNCGKRDICKYVDTLLRMAAGIESVISVDDIPDVFDEMIDLTISCNRWESERANKLMNNVRKANPVRRNLEERVGTPTRNEPLVIPEGGRYA